MVIQLLQHTLSSEGYVYAIHVYLSHTKIYWFRFSLHHCGASTLQMLSKCCKMAKTYSFCMMSTHGDHPHCSWLINPFSSKRWAVFVYDWSEIPIFSAKGHRQILFTICWQQGSWFSWTQQVSACRNWMGSSAEIFWDIEGAWLECYLYISQTFSDYDY